MTESDAHELLSDLLKNLSIELKTEDFDEMRAMLLASRRLDTVLVSLRDEYGFQILRGSDVVGEYQRSRRKEEVAPALEMLDYIIRKDNVELQLELRLAPAHGFGFARHEAEAYQMILAANPKTEEIVLVWATERLDSVALELKELQSCLQQDQEVIAVPESRLQPLSQTIVAALQRHRRIFRKPSDIEKLKRIRFDLVDAFSSALGEKIDKLKASAPRRRILERQLAIESISESDVEQITALFLESQRQPLKRQELESRLGAICEEIELESSEGDGL